MKVTTPHQGVVNGNHQDRFSRACGRHLWASARRAACPPPAPRHACPACLLRTPGLHRQGCPNAKAGDRVLDIAMPPGGAL